MNKALGAAVTILLSVGNLAVAHRLDEYLQASIISVEKNRLRVEVRLTPGVAVFPFVLAEIDSNGDGVISEPEQRAYAVRVLRDLSLTSDGDRVRPLLVATKFPAIEEMKEGRGEIQLEFAANLRRNAPNRSLIFENHHLSRISVYLVNCLVPRDPDIRIIAQNRNPSQSYYQLDYVLAGVRSDMGAWGWLGGLVVVLFARLALLWRQRRVKC